MAEPYVSDDAGVVDPLAVARARLLQLTQDGRVEALQAALADAATPSLDFVDSAGLSPLMYAVSKEGNEAVIATLLDGAIQRASIGYASPATGRTALHKAAYFGNLDAIDFLIARGANAEARDLEGRSPSQMDVHPESSSDSRAIAAAIYSATQKRDNPRPASPPEADVEASSSPSPPGPVGVEARSTLPSLAAHLLPSSTPGADSLLFDAAREGAISDLIVALDAGALVDRPDPATGLSALMFAAREGHGDVLEFLLTEAAANPDAQYAASGNATALHFAARAGQTDCVRLLVSKGARVYGLLDSTGSQADEVAPEAKVTSRQMKSVFAEALALAAASGVKSRRSSGGGTMSSSAMSLAAPAGNKANNPKRASSRAGNDDDGPYPAMAPNMFSPPTPLESTPRDPVRAGEGEGEDAEAQADEAEDDQLLAQMEQDRAAEDEDHEAAEQEQQEREERQQHPAAAAAVAGGVAQTQQQSPAAGASKDRPSYDPRDARAFEDLPLSEALGLVVARYRQTCREFGEPQLEFVCAALGNVAYAGQALLLGGASATPGRTLASQRLDDRSLYPLLEVLGYAFAHAPIQLLDLSFNHLGRTTAGGLVPFLAATRTLRELNLEGNDLDRVAGESLADAMMANPPASLTRINLNTNPLGPYALAKWAALLASNSTLLDLNLGNTECETLSLMKLASALQHNTTLKRLNLDSPLLFSSQEESTIHLARSIALNHSLTALSLKGHRMTDSGAAWLSEYLLPNTHLVDLNLSRNGLTNTGVAGFVKAIAHRRVECLITLDGNLLKGQASEEVADAIAATKGRNVVVFNTRQDRQSLRAKAPL